MASPSARFSARPHGALGLLFALLALAACGGGTASVGSGTNGSGTGSGSGSGNCVATGNNCLAGATCCDSASQCATDSAQEQVCCVLDGMAPTNGQGADCCSQNELDSNGNCMPGTGNGSAANGSAANGSAANGSATNGSATNGTATHGTAANGSATNGSAANGSATNGSAANGTATNGTSTTGAAGNGSAANGSGTNSTNSTSGGTRGTTSGATHGAGTTHGTGATSGTHTTGRSSGSTTGRSSSTTGSSCMGQQDCIPGLSIFCCDSMADCEPNSQDQFMCCVPDGLPPDNSDASACCSSNGIDSGGNCQPQRADGGTDAGASSSGGTTGGNQCTGQTNCDPTDPNFVCCDSAAECLTNSNGDSTCCVSEGSAPDNADGTACCSGNTSLDQNGDCQVGACVDLGKDCSGGESCCDNSLSCSVEPNGAEVCCDPDGTIPKKPADCCSQSGLDDGDGGACAPNGDAGACIADQAACFGNNTCCATAEQCENVDGGIICCVPFGAQSSNGGKDCCFGTANDGGVCAPTVALDFPQMPNNGGSPITAPNIITIEYTGYDSIGNVNAWGDWVASSDWLTQVGKDYGIGAGTHSNVTLSGTPGANLTDGMCQALLGALINDGGVPAFNANNLYMLFFPATTSVTTGNSASCTQFLGYHSFFQLNGNDVRYAVINTCPPGAGGDAGLLGQIQTTASHELMEAATDPVAGAGGKWQGYYFSDTTSPWGYVPGGAEVGDVCIVTQDQYSGTGGPFWAQRIWSNTAAQAENQSPCIPTPSGYEYFTTIVNNGDAGATATVAAGGTATFTATGWTQASLPSFTASVWSSVGVPSIGGGSSVQLNSGIHVALTVAVPVGLPSGTPVYVEVDSSLDGNVTYNSTPVVVFVQ